MMLWFVFSFLFLQVVTSLRRTLFRAGINVLPSSNAEIPHKTRHARARYFQRMVGGVGKDCKSRRSRPVPGAQSLAITASNAEIPDLRILRPRHRALVGSPSNARCIVRVQLTRDINAFLFLRSTVGFKLSRSVS